MASQAGSRHLWHKHLGFLARRPGADVLKPDGPVVDRDLQALKRGMGSVKRRISLYGSGSQPGASARRRGHTPPVPGRADLDISRGDGSCRWIGESSMASRSPRSDVDHPVSTGRSLQVPLSVPDAGRAVSGGLRVEPPLPAVRRGFAFGDTSPASITRIWSASDRG
jgi:hypothetical protein